MNAEREQLSNRQLLRHWRKSVAPKLAKKCVNQFDIDPAKFVQSKDGIGKRELTESLTRQLFYVVCRKESERVKVLNQECYYNPYPYISSFYICSYFGSNHTTGCYYWKLYNPISKVPYLQDFNKRVNELSEWYEKEMQRFYRI